MYFVDRAARYFSFGFREYSRGHIIDLYANDESGSMKFMIIAIKRYQPTDTLLKSMVKIPNEPS